MRSGPWVLPSVGLVCAGILLAGCTGSDPTPDNRETSAPARYDVPVAIMVNHSSELEDLSLSDAHKLIDDGVAPGSLTPVTSGVAEADAGMRTAATPAEAVSIAADDPGTVAIVPATDVSPVTRALTVDGIDPFRGEGYPLTTKITEQPGPVLVTTIVGDIMLGRRVAESLDRQRDPSAAFKPFAKRLAAADITVGNLESTLSRNGSPTQGGDSFAADRDKLAGLKLAGIDVLSLANNHLGDYGDRAINETVDLLVREQFAITGGGKNLAQARKPAIVEREGVRFGFIATDSIGETPAAREGRPGTNRINAPPRTGPLNRKALNRVSADIRKLAESADIVVVIPHWGTQYTHTPERSQRTLARAFASAGADLVVGGHPHWVQGWERMGESTVIHSLGNFIFDMDFMRKTNEGVFVEVVTYGDRVVAIEPVPYVIDSDFTPRPASAARARSIIGDIADSSRAPYDALR